MHRAYNAKAEKQQGSHHLILAQASVVWTRRLGILSEGDQGWYDPSMTRAKIAISLPQAQLARVHKEVRAGRADSVSGYIAQVLAEHERRESLQLLLQDLIKQYGKPAAEDIKWAERALAPHRV